MSQSQRSALTRQRERSAWVFLAPMLVILFCVAGWPLMRTIWFSFTDATIDTMKGGSTFIGLENYFGEYGLFATGKTLIQEKWGHAIGNTLLFALISVTLETVLGVIVALILNAEFKGRAFVRAAVLVPWAIPTIVSAKMWGWMLNDQFGVINYILGWFGMEPRAWVADPSLSMFSVVLVDVWKTTPFMALLVLAALQMLPKDCYEAAQVDGIHPVKVFFKVTLPLIKPALMVAVIFRLLDALRVFDLIYVLTSNSEDTISMSGYVRQEMIDNANVGFGSAAATVLFLIIGACTVAYMKFSKLKVD
ncbi:carbohydrate ABC transporter permease [Hydromonas duriensis]|uniref:Carbohydrate ABC transporter membrane protein 1 (CUT1 family) n=1 Tax=Hydromonas duriensis TaxID=1527608 RepID=A0A4R6YC47_9BURK|nr:sugar ABC transporter permease [Hydromonas duriensis]TDR33181.1 carbohydrate ABC transporter membrane protein 1 (CUT1 family) [Hydromonas duriensis]